jgi:sorting nexin-29
LLSTVYSLHNVIAIIRVCCSISTLECQNYRGIILLNASYKVFSNIQYKILLPYIEDIIGNYQYGFRQGKSATDAIHALRQILEKTREYNITTHHLFIDFKAAYDSIKREKLINAMKGFKILNKLVHLTEAILRRVTCSVKIYNDVSESFTTQRGVRQGDALACVLFNLALEKVIQNAGIEKTWHNLP